MKARFLTFFLICISLVSTRAELSPSVYEAKQRSAPEYLRLHVIDVNTSTIASSAAHVTHVRALAIVTQVLRTGSHVKIGDTLQVAYSITSHPKVWCGPGQIPLLKVQEDTVAYLIRQQEQDSYVPAAGAMSFHEF